jgi:hypothetical protein
MYSVVGLQSLITPAAVVAAILGIWISLKKRLDLLLIILVGFISIVPVLKSGEVKQLLTFVPAFMLCSLQGFSSIMSLSQNRLLKVMMVFMIILVLLPWFIGLKVYSPDTLWGPGFELRKPGENYNASGETLLNASILHKVLPIENISLAFNDGLALATGEGPRPVGAYGAILLGGKWRSFVLARDTEVDNAVQRALTENTPILLPSWNTIYVLKIVSKGFYPDAPLLTESDVNGIYRYTFENSNNQRILVYIPKSRSYLFDAERFMILQKEIGNSHAVYMVGDSSVGLEMFIVGSGSIEPLSPFTGIIDLEMYLEKLSEKK